MSLKKLHIRGVRNLQSVLLDDCGHINIFTGSNGSGKTSILEAIYILGSARSFRSVRLGQVINHLATRCVVYGELEHVAGQTKGSVGVMRSRGEQQLFKINGHPVHAAAQLAGLLPQQLINADTFSLLEGGARVRRQFLDWGVFHVEPDFLSCWRRAQRALKHRNGLLRRGRMSAEEMQPWDTELAACAEIIDRMRAAYLRRLRPVFLQELGALTLLERPDIEYHRGWPADSSLEQVLRRDLPRDTRRGLTHSGPHRADLDIRIEGRSAEQVLSRGQEKLLVCALRLAQGILLHELTGKTCIYLVDDLPSELDMHHRRALCLRLAGMRSQVFVTATDAESLRGCWGDAQTTRLFHVERGMVVAADT